MSNQGRRNRETKAEIHLGITATLGNRSVRITGTVHNQFAVPGVWLQGFVHCHLNRPGWLASAVEHYRRLGVRFHRGHGSQQDDIRLNDGQEDVLGGCV